MARRLRTPVTIGIRSDSKFYTVAQFDALIEYSEEYGADVPSYPIDDDYTLDTATINKQTKLQMQFFLTPYPVTWARQFSGKIFGIQPRVQIEEIKAALEKLHSSHRTVEIRTQETTYTEMAIRSISFTRSVETGDAYDVSASFVEVHKPERYEVVYVGDKYVSGAVQNGLVSNVNQLGSDTYGGTSGNEIKLKYSVSKYGVLLVEPENADGYGGSRR